MSVLTEVIRRTLALLKPPPALLISEWADSERMLSPESSAEPGRWNTDRTPYLREIMDVGKNPLTREVVFMSSAQVGKTETLNNMIGYFAHHDPSPMMLIQPTLGLAESYSKDRLTPMIRDTPALSKLFGEERSRSSGNTLLHKKFPGGHITLAGSNSPASLASRPVRVVFFDEVDRYPASAGTEGDPVSLGKKRSSTFFNRLTFLVSTPTIKGASRIELAFEASDKRRYHVPCPHCKMEFVMKFPNLKWDKNKPETAHFVCESCGAVIEHSHKMNMLRAGRWIAECPEVVGVVGFHLNELYSPWVHWGTVAATFLEAKKSPESLKTFINTSLGETWEIQGDAPEWKRLYDRRSNYKSNTLPAGVKFITAGADVQKNRIEVEIVGWGENCESWSIDYRTFLGDTRLRTTFEPLDDLMRERWADAEGVEIGVLRIAIDSGYMAENVYKWSKKYAKSKVMVVKGADDLDKIFQIPKQNAGGRTVRERENVDVWRVGVSMAKRELYGWLKQEIPSDEDLAERGYPHGFAHFPSDYGEEYFRMLTAEVEDIKLIRGFPHYIWVKRYDRNEALDCRIYNRAAAGSLGIDRMATKSLEHLTMRSRTEAKQDPLQKPVITIVKKKSEFLG